MVRRWGMSVAALGFAVCAVVAGAGGAAATPTPLRSLHDQLVTDDNWALTIDASQLVVNPMSNIANSPLSREGWVSSTVNATITGQGKQPVQSAILEQFLVVGCQVDVSSGAVLGVGLSFGPNVGVTISGVPGVTAGVSASVTPNISATIKPGRISEISLGKKQLQTDRASIQVKRAHVSVDGCWGPTTVRIIARLSVSTPTSDDTINVFSSRMWL